MVEFHCAQCGSTLKKKQVETHLQRGCYQVMCSGKQALTQDCGEMFEGMAYKEHCKCISEAQKFYGNYLRKTEQKKRQKQWKGWKETVKKCYENSKNQATIFNQACLEFMTTCHPEEVKKYQKEAQDLSYEQDWKGWKATLQSILLQERNGLKEDKLLDAAVQRFNLSFKRAHIPEEEIKKTVRRKLQNRRYILRNGRVRLRD